MDYKRYSQKNPKKKGLLTFLLAVPLIFLIFFILLYFQIENKASWSWDGRFNVLDTENYIITSYSPPGENDAIIKLPANYYVDMAGNHGEYRLKDVAKIAETFGEKDKLLKETIEETLGIPIDTFSSNLTFFDKAKIYLKQRGKNNLPKEINLEDLVIYNEETLVDGSIIKKIDLGKVDYYLNSVFWEKSIKEENLKIGIFNASTTSGLATSIARKLENIGAKVVNAGNWDKAIKQCQLKTTKENKKTKTVIRLRKIFPNCVFEVATLDDRYDVVIIAT